MVTVGLHDGGANMIHSPKGLRLVHTPANRAGSPTVLLIHGFLDDATVWDDVVGCLGGETGAVRYDLPGFGTRIGSVAQARGTTLESLAAEAGEIVKGIDGPVIVVGQSLGTQIAELVATQYQDLVRGLVLLTPVPLAGTKLTEEAADRFRALGGNHHAQRRARAELSPGLSDEQLDRLADIGAPVASDVVSHYVNVWNDGINNTPMKSAFLGPVLIIRGGADAFVTEQVVDRISTRFVDADVKVIGKGGHWVHIECPGAVAAMLLDFADAVAEAAP